jgi:hypothetical protein
VKREGKMREALPASPLKRTHTSSRRRPENVFRRFSNDTLSERRRE